MTPEQRQIVNEGLSVFNAKLTEDYFIKKADRVPTGVKVAVSGRRLRFENGITSDLIASGPITSAFTKSFCKKFWFWEEVK